MCTPFQLILKSHYPSIYYGYETIHENVRPTRAEYNSVFASVKEAHRDLLVDMLRQQRNQKVTETDYLVLPDYPITDERRTQVMEYRQKLRDITKGELPRFSRVDYVLEFDLSEEGLMSGSAFIHEVVPEVVNEIVDTPVKVVL